MHIISRARPARLLQGHDVVAQSWRTSPAPFHCLARSVFLSATRPRTLAELRYFSANSSLSKPSRHLSQRLHSSVLGSLRPTRPGRFRLKGSNRSAHNSTQYQAPTGKPDSELSLSQRLKKLSREYGWSALGVYLLLSLLDFPLCFLAVRHLGTERIAHWEHKVVEAFWSVVAVAFPNLRTAKQSLEGSTLEEVDVAEAAAREGARGHGDEVKKAKPRNGGDAATIWTQLALAYAVHKSLIFFRVPLTAAATPKVVKTLRGWGWNIGRRTPKGPQGP